MFKKGLNPWAVWGLAFFATLAVFGIGYGVVSFIAYKSAHSSPDSHSEGHDSDHTKSQHGGDHGPDTDKKAAHGPDTDKKDAHGHEASPASHEPESGDHHNGAKNNHDDSQWTYSGSQGPQAWGDLDGKYALCKSGKSQSPIDIDETIRKSDLLPIRFHYKPVSTMVKNGGRAIIADVPKHSLYVEIEGERYDLIHYTFRIPSEHRVSGHLYDGELQLVHQHANGKLAIIGVLLEEGKILGALDTILKAIPEEVGESSQAIEMNPIAMLPTVKTFFQYDGSLTTPPCEENVRWYVLTQPSDVSAKQIDTLAHFYKNNARPVQKTFGRKVLRSAR